MAKSCKRSGARSVATPTTSPSTAARSRRSRPRSNWAPPNYKKLVDLLDQLDGFKIRHVPREQNTRADALANAALDGKLNDVR